MRELGSQSLRLICALDLDVLAPQAIDKIVRLFLLRVIHCLFSYNILGPAHAVS